MPKDPWNDPWDDEEGSPTASDEMPEGGEEKPEWLKPFHVGKKQKGTMELLGVSNETSEYSDVVLHVKFNGVVYALGLKLFSPDYKACLKFYGKKKADWHGPLAYRVTKYKDTSYVSIRPIKG